MKTNACIDCGRDCDRRGERCIACAGKLRSIPPSTRFWKKVNKTSGCWLWVAFLSKGGYGRFQLRDKVPVQAHVFSYEEIIGPVPKGLQLDHLCRTRNCVNPDHLEPVTPLINVGRGMSPGAIAQRTDMCSKGHPYVEGSYKSNSQGWRVCLVCRVDCDAAYRANNREKMNAATAAWRRANQGRINQQRKEQRAKNRGMKP
jgi:hypothetical protein